MPLDEGPLPIAAQAQAAAQRGTATQLQRQMLSRMGDLTDIGASQQSGEFGVQQREHLRFDTERAPRSCRDRLLSRGRGGWPGKWTRPFSR